MISAVASGRLEWLKAAADSGEIHTVRLSWPDRLGTMRGKRLPADLFLEEPSRRIGFCDGMIVVDVNCDVIQETPFSNFETGYPDMYLRPRLDTLERIGWADGEAVVFGDLEDHDGKPLAVAPSNVLAGVVARLRDAGVEVKSRLVVSGRIMQDRQHPVRLLPDGQGVREEDPGILRLALDGIRETGVEVRSLETDRLGGFRFGLDWAEPGRSAEQAVLVKAAMKELTRSRGVDAVFMTALPDLPGPSCLEVNLGLEGTRIEVDGLGPRLSEVRAILQPSINALKAGAVEVPSVDRRGGGSTIRDLKASSEADPATVLMAVLAAVGTGLDGSISPPAYEVGSLHEATTRLADSEWARDWLGAEFIDNAVALLRHESTLFDASVTDWELDRYWSAA